MTKTEALIIAYEVLQGVSNDAAASVQDKFLPLLDEITFLTPKMLNFADNGSLTGSAGNFMNVLMIIANSCIIAILLLYGFKSLFAYFFSSDFENPWKIVVRILVVGIIMNCAYFITYNISWFTSELTDLIRDYIGSSKLTFDNLQSVIGDVISEVEDTEEINIFDTDVFMSIFIHFGVITLSVVYMVRYIAVKVLIILSPIAFLTAMIKDTEKVFFVWLKLFCSLMFMQIVIAIILGIPNMFTVKQNLFSQVLVCAIIVILHRINFIAYSNNWGTK